MRSLHQRRNRRIQWSLFSSFRNVIFFNEIVANVYPKLRMQQRQAVALVFAYSLAYHSVLGRVEVESNQTRFS
jgi:hypothetical protein